MTPTPVLVLNTGSSSLKYQLVVPETKQVQAGGLVQRIGEPGAEAADHRTALRLVAERLADEGLDLETVQLRAVGHRVVHGGPDFSDPALIDDDVVRAIGDLAPLAPLHNRAAVIGIEAARERFHVPHVAVFDTAFFSSLPAAASTYALPAALAKEHRIRRYGFHGTSHQFVSAAAAVLVDRPLEELNQIVLHLGNGASASAIRSGRAVDTSMGLTPLEGLVMGTRSGDIDPGLPAFLGRTLGLGVAEIDDLLNTRSGIKGLTGSNDFRELGRRRTAGDAVAILATDVYLHRLRHYVGAYLAVLGRVDLLVFTAGIGENDPFIRASLVDGLEGLGFAVDPARNAEPSTQPRVISPDGSRVTVAVVPTNEELAIARQAAALVDCLP